MKYIITFLLFSSVLFSDEFPVYYISEDAKRFSILGYDIESDQPVPFELNQVLEVNYIGRLELPAGAYREIIEINHGEDGIFQTRINSDAEESTVIEVEELERSAKYSKWPAPQSCTMTLIYKVTFDNGIIMEIGQQFRDNGLYEEFFNYEIIPGDTFRFTSENQPGLDFKKAFFSVQHIREGKPLRRLFGKGTARKGKLPHIPSLPVIIHTGARFSWTHGVHYNIDLKLRSPQLRPGWSLSHNLQGSPHLWVSGSKEIYELKAEKADTRQIRAGTQLQPGENSKYLNLDHGSKDWWELQPVYINVPDIYPDYEWIRWNVTTGQPLDD